MSISTGYAVYLQSAEWRAKRAEKLAEVGHRCQGCPETDRLEVHHLTYERVGHERMGDLMVLCHWCHSAEHGRSPNVGPAAGPDVNELTRRARETERLEHHQGMVLVCANLRHAVEALYEIDGDAEYRRDVGFMVRRAKKLEARVALT
jgi:hypothetical protein